MRALLLFVALVGFGSPLCAADPPNPLLPALSPSQSKVPWWCAKGGSGKPPVPLVMPSSDVAKFGDANAELSTHTKHPDFPDFVKKYNGQVVTISGTVVHANTMKTPEIHFLVSHYDTGSKTWQNAKLFVKVQEGAMNGYFVKTQVATTYKSTRWAGTITGMMIFNPEDNSLKIVESSVNLKKVENKKP